MSPRIFVLLFAAIISGCASRIAPTGPRLQTRHSETSQQLNTGEVVLVCLAGVALDIVISGAIHDDHDSDHDDSHNDLPVAELVCESAQLPP